MWFPASTTTTTTLSIFCLCFLPVLATFSTQICENGRTTSPRLSDCYAAFGQIPNTDEAVKQLQISRYDKVVGTYEVESCLIMIRDFTPPGMKAIDKSTIIKWDELHNLTGTMIDMCSATASASEVITGGVVIIGRM
ncbi:MAG: hypothetical protein Q9216_002421 [Gyalolechia sp. 2 TL-2023]